MRGVQFAAARVGVAKTACLDQPQDFTMERIATGGRAAGCAIHGRGRFVPTSADQPRFPVRDALHHSA